MTPVGVRFYNWSVETIFGFLHLLLSSTSSSSKFDSAIATNNISIHSIMY